MDMIKWQIFADASKSQPLYEGALPVQQLQGASTCSEQGRERLWTTGVDATLSPSIARESQRLLQQTNAFGAGDAIEFQVPAAELTLFPAGDDAEDPVDRVPRDATLLCRLELQQCGVESVENDEGPVESDWFQWKISRASYYRARGNDAFKQGRLRAARRLYAKALAWLQCPPECAFDADELALATPLQTACRVNLATCLWKLGEMEACIEQCSSALALDATHVKARYRRGQAYLATKEFDLALADLAATLELEPDNKLFASSLERARVAKQQFNRKQREAFGKLFPQ